VCAIRLLLASLSPATSGGTVMIGFSRFGEASTLSSYTLFWLFPTITTGTSPCVITSLPSADQILDEAAAGAFLEAAISGRLASSAQAELLLPCSATIG
jgi:hypothetical protein